MRISKETEEHIRNHLKYPAAKKDIVDQCNGMADVSREEKALVVKLPDREYEDASEVLQALNQI